MNGYHDNMTIRLRLHPLKYAPSLCIITYRYLDKRNAGNVPAALVGLSGSALALIGPSSASFDNGELDKISVPSSLT